MFSQLTTYSGRTNLALYSGLLIVGEVFSSKSFGLRVLHSDKDSQGVNILDRPKILNMRKVEKLLSIYVNLE
jgi:hypothetical protein